MTEADPCGTAVEPGVGLDAADLERRLADLEAELKAVTETPPPDWSAFAEETLKRFSAFPANFQVQARISVLVSLATNLYLDGRAMRQAREAIVAAVALAEQGGDLSSLRRALSVQGLILSSSRQFAAALTCLARARALAESLHDVAATAAAWVNTGIVFEEAVLVGESMDCFRTVIDSYLRQPDARLEGVTSVAYQGLAIGHLYFHQYRDALEAIGHAIPLVTSLSARETHLKAALMLATQVQAQLGLKRLDDAENSARECMRRAEASSTKRAEIGATVTRARVYLARGDVDQAMALLSSVRDMASLLPGQAIDYLRALVSVHESAGHTDDALASMREIVSLNKAAQQAQLREYWESASSSTALARPEPFHDEEARLTRVLSSRLAKLEETAITAALVAGHDLNRIFRVATLTRMLARAERWSDAAVQGAGLAAKLMDIGVVALDKEMLLQRRPLSPNERRIVAGHTTLGADLIAGANLPSLDTCVLVARHHHDWWDGTMPSALAGEAIPAAARLASICDVFDALTHDRPWRPKLTVPAALGEILQRAGTQFEPRLAKRFVALIRREYWKHTDFEAFLSADAAVNELVRARERIAVSFTATK